jgi:hypothetical protein
MGFIKLIFKYNPVLWEHFRCISENSSDQYICHEIHNELPELMTKKVKEAIQIKLNVASTLPYCYTALQKLAMLSR